MIKCSCISIQLYGYAVLKGEADLPFWACDVDVHWHGSVQVVDTDTSASELPEPNLSMSEHMNREI